MPYDEPEPDDPNVLVGISLPGDESTSREMATAFADEFARMGFTAGKILDIFRSSFYAGAHRAFLLLGESETRRLVDESVGFWGRVRHGVREASTEPSPVNTVWKKES